jgi:hypothetical protein
MAVYGVCHEAPKHEASARRCRYVVESLHARELPP